MRHQFRTNDKCLKSQRTELTPFCNICFWHAFRSLSADKVYLFASVVASAALEFNENLTKQFISENLHFTSPHINELKNLWFSQYDHLSFVDLKFGSEAKSLNDFHQSVVESADSIRDILVSNWIPQCAEIVKTGLQNEKESLRSSKNKNGILPGSGIYELTIGS